MTVKLYQEREMLRKENIRLSNSLRRTKAKVKRLEARIEELENNDQA